MVDMVDMTLLSMFLYTYLEEQIIVMTHSLSEVMDVDSFVMNIFSRTSTEFLKYVTEIY